MALSNLQALDVVIGCVRGVSGHVVPPNQTLRSGGIVDPARLGAFRSLVVSDRQLGVEKHNHRIHASALSSVAVDDFVQATADVVRANATAIAARVAARHVRAADTAPAGARAESAKRVAALKAKKPKAARSEASRKKASRKPAQRIAATKKKRASVSKGRGKGRAK